MPLKGYPPLMCLLERPDLVMVEVGGVSDGCQMWRLFSRPDLMEVGGISDGCQMWRLFSGPDLMEVGGVSDGCQLWR